MTGMTTLMTFEAAPPLVYFEGLHSGQLVDDPGLVARYRKSYDLLRAAAMPRERSLVLIEAAAKDYRDDRPA
jgi:hypothetical protein